MHYSATQKSRKIMNIALPAGANSLIDMLNLFVGMYFIAQFSKDHIVALGVSMSYLMIFHAINAVFFIGTSSQVARFYGAKNMQKLYEVIGNNFIMTILFSLPFTIFVYRSSGIFLEWMGEGVSEKAKELGLIYLGLTSFGIALTNMKSVFVAALSAIGNTKIITYIKIIIIGLNILLNYTLIFGVKGHIPQLGILGAAISNLIILSVELIYLFLVILTKHAHLGIIFCIKSEYCKRSLQVGIPAGLERLLSLLGLVLVQRFISSYGVDVLAGVQIGSKIEGFILTLGFGFQVASMAIIGQNIGRNRFDLIYEFNKMILLIASFCMGILGILICIFATSLSSIFSNDILVTQNSNYYIYAVGLSQIPLVIAFCLDGALRGAGITTLSLAINTFSIWCLRIIPMWIGVRLGTSALWIFGLIFIETYIRAVIFYLVFKTRIWEKYLKN